MRAAPLAVLALVVGCGLGVVAARAEAGDVGLYKYDRKGKVKAVRAADMDGDGRLDLVLLVESPRGDAPAATEILVLYTPKTPTAGTFFDEKAATRLVPGSGYPADGRRGASRAPSRCSASRSTSSA